MSERITGGDKKQRMIIIGLDGYEARIADSLIADGHLPHIASLMKRSACVDLDHGRNKLTGLSWQHFATLVTFPKPGYYEIWAKATDDNEKSQPMVLPGWNPKGYLNNACHRIAVKVES